MKLKPLRGLTSILRILLKVNVGILFVAVAAGIFDFYTYYRLPPEVDPHETIFTSDSIVAFVGGIQFAMVFVVGVPFLLWIYRITLNLRALSSKRMNFTPIWSIGWYFVPFANLFMPYRAMKEIWRVATGTQSSYDAILAWWWTLWIVSSLLIQFAAFNSDELVDRSDFIFSALAYLVSDSVDIVLSLVALALITRIGSAYEKNFGADRGEVSDKMPGSLSST